MKYIKTFEDTHIVPYIDKISILDSLFEDEINMIFGHDFYGDNIQLIHDGETYYFEIFSYQDEPVVFENVRIRIKELIPFVSMKEKYISDTNYFLTFALDYTDEDFLDWLAENHVKEFIKIKDIIPDEVKDKYGYILNSDELGLL